jgi:hypothetical protein
VIDAGLGMCVVTVLSVPQPAVANAVVDECLATIRMVMLPNGGAEVRVVRSTIGPHDGCHDAPGSRVLLCSRAWLLPELITPDRLAFDAVHDQA